MRLRLLRLLACVFSLSVAAGCGNPCLDLAAQVCACLPDDGTRAACNQRAKEAQTTFSVRDADQQFCQKQLDSHACDCKQLATPEGKVGCGISYVGP
jgi:hypothetical protein